MIRTKGEAGTGDIVEAVRHIRAVKKGIAEAQEALNNDKKSGRSFAIQNLASRYRCSTDLLTRTAELGRLPVVNFAAGGVATPADAALMMQLGCDGVFVGSGIFKSGDAAKRAKAIVRAVTHYNDSKIVAECSEGLGEAMVGISVRSMPAEHQLAKRGW
jgi:pyridoxal 5'-phosphate synthase pdxS subunit